MEMTINPVQLGLSSQPQAKASDTGFSDILTEVRTASPQSGDVSLQMSSEQTDTDMNISVDTANTAVIMINATETVSVEFENTVMSLISGMTDGSKEENDRIIGALLEILKKMQENSEDDPAVNLAMELLTAMLGETKENPVFNLTLTKSETAVTSVNTEITAILSAEEAAAPQTMAEISAQTESAPVHPMQTADIAQASANEASVTAHTDGTAETPVQAQDIQTAQTDTYGKLLNDILAAAKKELGLTKAEFTQTEAAQQEAPVTARQETVNITLNLNRKDGTDELNTILGAASDEPAEAQEIKAVPQLGEAAAALTENIPQQTAPVNETEVKVEAPLPEQQLADEILSKPETIQGGRTEFTMELNPESLGKITVRLVSTEGRVEVNITAENDSTRQLLESRAENIGAALKNSGVELERYQVVSDREEAQLMQESYDGSSRNPYGRNDEEQQNEENGDDFLEILQQL